MPAVGHAVAAQGLQLGPAQLHRVVTKHIGQQGIGLLLLPSQQARRHRLTQTGQPCVSCILGFL
jgi:hypothetical protein